MVVALIVWLARVDDIQTALPLGLIIGGAVGNVVDRVRFGQGERERLRLPQVAVRGDVPRRDALGRGLEHGAPVRPRLGLLRGAVDPATDPLELDNRIGEDLELAGRLREAVENLTTGWMSAGLLESVVDGDGHRAELEALGYLDGDG